MMGAGLILAVAAGSLYFVEPRNNLTQTLPRVVRAEDLQPRHQIMVGKAEHGPAVLHLAAPGDAFRTVPRPEIPIEVAFGGGSRAEAPVVDVLALRRVRSEEHTSELQSLRHLVCR